MRRDFLVDNPIYKTVSSSSLLENGRVSTTVLRSVGSDPNISQSPKLKQTAADNPQYGTHFELQPPPPNQKPPRYIKVSTGEAEPMYELIEGSKNKLTTAAEVAGPNLGDVDDEKGDPVYSTPGLPVKPQATVPLYESTMDIPATAGKDGEYSKLNHDKI